VDVSQGECVVCLCWTRTTRPRLLTLPWIFAVLTRRRLLSRWTHAGGAARLHILYRYFTAGKSLFQQFAVISQIPSRRQTCTNFPRSAIVVPFAC